MILKRLSALLFAAALFVGCTGLAVPAHAQVTAGLNEVGQTVKLSSANPITIAVRIINIALGLIGIILVTLILYAGFVYMTSGGDAKKTTQAKQIITNAVIGLVIVLSAWAITTFVISRLLNATAGDGGGGVGGSGGGGFGGGFGGGGGSQSFQVKSISPIGSVGIRNVQVKIVFTKTVDDTSTGAIVIAKNGQAVAGTLETSGQLVTFTPNADCPAPNQTKKCFDGDSDFTVTVGGSVRSTGGQAVNCGFGASCQGAFHTGNLVDTSAPRVSLTFPTDGMKVQQDFLQDLEAQATDDSGVATVEFFDGSSSVDIDGPTGSSTPASFTAHGSWDTAGAVLGLHSLTATAKDIDTNTADSAAVSVVVRPAHCFNNKQDTAQGETGIDCGGDSNSQDYCGSCAGGSCTKNADCSSGFCVSGVCVEKPVIQSVTPLDGKPGTFVTLKGVNFGYGAGEVVFLGGTGTADDKVAVAPAACVSAGISTWGANEVIVSVPQGAASGPIELKNAGSGLIDDTNDTNGPQIPNFLANNTVHPGLCALQPTGGTTGSQVDAVGEGFGGAAGKVEFGTTELSSPFAAWTDPKVTFSVPVVNSAPYQVSINVGTDALSNPVTYTVQDRNTGAAPRLDSIDPGQGAKQTYITLFGANFGGSIGTVVFTDAAGQEAIGDTSFPAACRDAFWHDDRVVVKVPNNFKNNQPLGDGAYQVKIVRADVQASNSLPFTVNSQLPLLPGICAIEPSAGPVGTSVTLSGEHFGNQKPSLTFTANLPALITGNTDQGVDSSVPNGSVTGPIQLKSAQGQLSNKVNFAVRNCNEAGNICGGNEQCCASGECLPKSQSCGAKSMSAEFAWQTSTGLIPIAPRVVEECRPDLVPSPTPSPAPWLGRSGGDQAPVDAAITMRFSQPLDPSTVTNQTFHFLKCTSASTEPCATTEPVSYSLLLAHENNEQDVVKLTPAQPFAISTTYLVQVVSTVKSNGPQGTVMEVMRSCGTGTGNETYGYCFRFKTKNDATQSTVGSVNVIPSSYTVHDTGTILPSPAYQAEPIDGADKCIVLDCNRFDWTWYTGASLLNQDSRASVTNKKVNGLGACAQDVTAIAETGAVPVPVNASLSAANLLGTGNLFVSFIPPSVISYAPNCDQACLNAAASATFNETMNAASFGGNVVVQKCFNENCNEAELSQPLAIPANKIKLITNGTKISIEPVSNNQLLLEPGGFYHVLLRSGPTIPNGGIRGTNGLPILNANNPQGFVWTFRVKLASAGAICKAARVDVDPVEKYETIVGAAQTFLATPYSDPDVCSATGEQLITIGGTSWQTSKPTVAKFFQQNGQLIDTADTLPPGCSGSCLATGAYSQAGKVAICGNGKIETTDVHYCVSGKTPKGDNCTVMPAGAAAGEECEPSIDGNACDLNTCLFRPVASILQSGTCGNGVLDKAAGEACDYGPTCLGGGNATSSPAVADGTSCLSATAKTSCENAGGTCAMHTYRGCSADCRHLGSAAGKTTCGNGDFQGDGKDCDDGNQTSGDGCSAICLHEPSQPSTALSAVCGNGVLEAGETCEAKIVSGQTVFPAGCNQQSCLHTGTIFCASAGDPSCCGNAKIDSGEDCDDGNHTSGDSCSASCLLEGSSVSYNDGAKMTPSFCGNGILEAGEQCELGADSAQVANDIGYGTPGASYANALGEGTQSGDGVIDDLQLAFIVGEDLPDPTSGKMSSQLSAALQGQTGNATYGLQCGFTDESSCAPQGPDYGLDTNGCCSLRPKITTQYPLGNGICRNVQIKVTFRGTVDVGSAVTNFEIDQQAATKCPDGTTEVLVDGPQPHGIRAWFASAWAKVLTWFGAPPAYASKWCKGSVTGQLQPVASSANGAKTFIFTLDHALDSNTTYRVRFLGDNSTTPDPLSDNADKEKRLGIKTTRGVVHAFVTGDAGDLVWTFKTGTQVCAANVVTIEDVTPDPAPPDVAHPFMFVNPDNQPETRNFLATAQSIQNGQAVALSPILEYAWSWDAWTSSDKTVVTAASTQGQGTSNNATATSKQKNGNAILTATLEVTKDTINTPSSTGSAIQGIAPVAVLVCENPWPKLTASPFRDADPNAPGAQSSFKPGDLFYAGPFYNFSTMYCRDAGDAHDASDDVPALKINQIPQTNLDRDRGILRQYLFTYPKESPSTPQAYRGLQKDGIGIRIVANPQHLSPMEWYQSKGFKGSPTVVKVDGYPAVQDGTTIYVAGANRAGASSGAIYSNIYVLSENPDAGETTRQVFDQLVKYLTFNINITTQSNVCVKNSNGAPFTSAQINGGEPVQCSTDYECFAFGANNLHCDSTKLKLERDTQRMTDFQALSDAFDGNRSPNGTYPTASGGTFLRNVSTSLWSSWFDELGKTLGTSMPADPVNKFLTCGECSVTKTPCQSVADCPVQGGVAQTCMGGSVAGGAFVPDPNIDPASCWNESNHQYVCPNLSPLVFPTTRFGVSRLYQFKSLAGGTRYDIGSEFEVPPPANPSNNWWVPTLPTTVYRCASTSTFGVICSNNNQPDDSLCRPCAQTGTCKTCAGGPKAGQTCSDSSDCGSVSIPCMDQAPKQQGACRASGGSFEYTNLCNNVPFGASGSCGDGVLNPGETCEAGMTQGVSCNAGTGTKQQICNLNGPQACNAWIDDPQHPQCVANTQCGNGRVDTGEKCDEGALNGIYGHCNTTCQSYAGYCGDGQLSPGEICDNGSTNGTWSTKYNANTCSLDCRGTGPYCGNGVVDGPEQCDGTSITTQSAICGSGPNINQTCTTNADCGQGGTCGGPGYASCVGFEKTVKTCTSGSNLGDACTTDSECGSGGKCTSFTRQTQHTRTCAAPGTKAGPVDISCQLGFWSACEAVGSCGDGIKDVGEQCDDGSGNGDTKACTSQCKKNVCGDGKTYEGTEECDNGANNGKKTCTADYNSMCLSCSNLCKFQASAGGYCGDNKKNGAEQCDGDNTVPSDVSCQSLGYDYASELVDLKRTDHVQGICAIVANGDLYNAVTYDDDSGSTWNQFASQYNPAKVQFLKDLAAQGHPITQSTIELMQSGADADDTGYFTFSGCAGTTFETRGAGVTCTNECAFGGCAKCSDQPGHGSISGRVFDAVFQEVVPNARVSLLFKGVKVDETYTDPDGLFKLSTLNTNNACTGYRIVIDMYQDNPCTGPDKGVGTSCNDTATPPWPDELPSVDEGTLGGYFPYTSPTFTASSFGSVMNNLDGDATSTYHIDIFPRPDKGQAYAAITWDSTKYGHDSYVPTLPGPMNYKAHTVLPHDAAFTRVDWDASPPAVSTTCKYDDRPASTGECIRDVTWQAVGTYDIQNALPYSRLFCLHRAGEKTEGFIDSKKNGCPIEGTKDCEINAISTLTLGACQNGLSDVDQASSCFNGWACSSNNPNAASDCQGGVGGIVKSSAVSATKSSIKTQCADDSAHSCSADPDYADCVNPAHFGPITTMVNYAKFASLDGKVNFYFTDTFNNSSATLKSRLTSRDFTAYVAYSPFSSDSQLRTISNPSGNGWAWHIADISPKNDTLTTVNSLTGNDDDPETAANHAQSADVWRPIDGMGAWTYWFQGAGRKSYCVNKNDNTKIRGAGPACFTSSEKSDCNATTNYKCGGSAQSSWWDYDMYEKFTW